VPSGHDIRVYSLVLIRPLETLVLPVEPTITVLVAVPVHPEKEDVLEPHQVRHVNKDASSRSPVENLTVRRTRIVSERVVYRLDRGKLTHDLTA